MESDPLGLAAGINTYLYASASPISNIDPLGLADCSYSVSTHTLMCMPNAGGTIVTLGPNGVFSGVGRCRNQDSCTNLHDLGPIPPGYYNMNPDSRPGHEHFWRLEPNPQVPGWRCMLGLNRCGFELHPGGISLGCITTDKNDPKAMNQYSSIDALLNQEVGGNNLTVVP